jgi:zinc transporter
VTGVQTCALPIWILAETIVWLNERDKRQLHETANHLIRIVEDLDSIRDRALVAQEETFNQLSQQMNTKMYILSLMTAIFLPLTFLTGLLGINVGGVPGANYAYAFYVVSGLLLLLCVVQIFYFRKKKWL